MEQRSIFLMFFVLALSLYVGLEWLSWMLAIGAFFMILSTVKLERAEPVPVGGAAQEEILTPVIVQDVGEAPYLYPPDFRMKIKPDWNANTPLENMGAGMGTGLTGLINMFRGAPLRGNMIKRGSVRI